MGEGRLDPVILLAGLTYVALVVLYLPGVLSPSARRLIAEYHVQAWLLALTIFAIRHGLAAVTDRRQREFWNRLTVAFSCWLAADAIYLVSSGEPVSVGLSVLGDALYFSFYLVLLLATEQRGHLGARWSERYDLRRLRIAGSVAFLTALLSYFVLIPLWLDRPEYASKVPSFLLFVALDALLVLRLIVMMRESRGSPWRWIYGSLAGAVSIWMAGDAMDGLYYAGLLPIESGTWLDFLYFAPYALPILATRVRNRDPGRMATVTPQAAHAPGRSALPGLLIVYLLALPLVHFAALASGWGEAESRPQREAVVVLGLLALCALALVHELGMRRRNRELSRRLDDLLVGEKLESVQRLESLGVLAGGIAHDFNNLLVGILGNANLILQEPSLDRESRERAEQIQQAALQAADLTSQMLTYAGRGEFTLEARDLNEIVAETADLLAVAISKKAELTCLQEPGLPPVAVDAVQIRQLIMNLITNASEALGDGAGKVTVTTEVVEATAAELAEMHFGDGPPPGTFVALSVADNGSGMTDRVRQKMFDPFFSTKFPGRGLGLAAVLGIVRSHRGALDVASEIGAGTTVRVLLPVTGATASRNGGAAGQGERWLGEARGTVLVVEDEDVVRRVARAMLETLGLRVIEARDGREGLDVFRQQETRIAVVLLDLTMPVMGGAEALARMQRLRPEVPVLVMSGYDDHSARRRCAGLKPWGFLRKPFRFEDLRAALSPILEREPAAAEGPAAAGRPGGRG